MDLNGYECDRCHKQYLKSEGVGIEPANRVRLTVNPGLVLANEEIVLKQVCATCVQVINTIMEPLDRKD